MCGRYYIAEDDQAEELKQIIDMINRKHNGDGSVKTAGEIFPSEKVPVITTSRAQKIIPFPMEWGYSTSDGNRLINARSETASQKPTFKDGNTANGDHYIDLPGLKEGQLVVIEAENGSGVTGSWIRHSSTETFVLEGQRLTDGKLKYEVREDADYTFQLKCDDATFDVSISVWEKK